MCILHYAVSVYKKEKGLGNTFFKNNKLNSSKIDNILRKETYIGTSIQNVHCNENYRTHKEIKRNIDDWIFNENHHEPIISKRIFKEAQIILDNKTKTKFNDSKDILSGYFKCFDCNSTMYLKKGKTRNIIIVKII